MQLRAGEQSTTETDTAQRAVLEVSDLRVRFGSDAEGRYVVDGLSYSVAAGETLAIIGESGSGKTVSSRAIMGLLPRSATVTGSARLQGEELIGIGRKAMQRLRGPGLAMVFQDPARSLNPTMRVGSQVAEALRLHFDLDARAAREQAIGLLEKVRLPAARERFYQYPHQLSGGMRQRVMIAIALACRPKLLFADEATSALDVTTQAKIMELLAELQREMNMAVVMISHNLGLAANFADQVVVMYSGHVLERGPTGEVFDEVRQPYTKLLLDAVPRVDRMVAWSAAEGEQAVEADSSGAGCVFAPRCSFAQPRCRESAPPLEPQGAAHRWACWYPIDSRST